jgi:hypothetical protein
MSFRGLPRLEKCTVEKLRLEVQFWKAVRITGPICMWGGQRSLICKNGLPCKQLGPHSAHLCKEALS